MPCNYEVFMTALCSALGKIEFMVKMLTYAMDTDKGMNNALSVKVLRDLIKANTALTDVLTTLAPNVDPKPAFDSDLVNMLVHNDTTVN